jgi:glycosyltransferase involved in cell wall biosynthesis
LHWVNHGLVNIDDLPTWNKPLVWTMRDMWPFTGGCHHALGCERFLHQCGRCPLLGSSSAKDLSARALARKAKYLSRAGIRWVAVSHWLRDEAARSALLKSASIRVIPSGVRTADFVRVDKATARRALGLPDKGKVVLLGANNLREEYKGFVFALAALRVAPGPLTVVTFGHAVIEPSEIPHQVVNLGYIRGAEKLSAVYSAADVFLAPSVGESFGKTFAEAQSCGLPVVCFANTGPADIVDHPRTGYLAARGDEADLAAGLFFALSEEFDRQYISERARTRFDIGHAAEQYREMYEELANG